MISMTQIGRNEKRWKREREKVWGRTEYHANKEESPSSCCAEETIQKLEKLKLWWTHDLHTASNMNPCEPEVIVKVGNVDTR